ncbi:uncharacterized protein LOC114289509 [Camellia sinensis]|uniref:uncharacterized protein LOC114289509 n=1 Tax=Camellia sinensis TaxID=4442 RepID=UPI001036AD8C|nr:uncharacterized protein LOC114289509 [Camellia sinensis]
MAIKLDFNKAYDRVEWDFLLELMRRMGFAPKWIQWVSECITTVIFSVFVNREKQAAFTLSHGLRQGDPLSLYLFILVADVLSKLITHNLHRGQLSGFKINRHSPTLSHLLFADDVLLFLKEDQSECLKILDILSSYCIATGQLVNFDKSSVQFSLNVSFPLRGSIRQLSGFRETPVNAKYLGLPTFWRRSKAEAYDFIIERVQAKLQGWKLKLLSHIGQETLIKVVVQAIPSYAMACFIFPKNFCAKLNSLISKFWWNGDPESKGIHWVNWAQLAMPKSEGGLGFRDFHDFNLALVAKQGWRLVKYPNSFCAKMLKGIYFSHSNFMEASRGRCVSWAWASLIQSRKILCNGVRWQVYNGASINFWDDKWIPSLPGFKVSSPKPPISRVSAVVDIIDATHGIWKVEDL